jgi:hypothetical protein
MNLKKKVNYRFSCQPPLHPNVTLMFFENKHNAIKSVPILFYIFKATVSHIPSFSKCVVFIITWRAICSKKLAAPLVLADSAREPASIQTPTVAAPAEGFSSVATVKPLGKLVMRVAEACLAAVAKGRTN